MAEGVTARPDFDSGFSRVDGFSVPTKTTLYVNQTAVSDGTTLSTASSSHPVRRATLPAVYVAPIVIGISILIFLLLGVLWFFRRRAKRNEARGSITSTTAQPVVREYTKWWSDSDMNSAFSGTTLPRERLSAIQRSMRRQRQQGGGCTCHDNHSPFKDGPATIREEAVSYPPKAASPVPRPGDVRYMDEDELRDTGVGLPCTPRATSQASCRDMAEVRRAFELEEEQQRMQPEARRPPTPIPFHERDAGPY